jgi:hypothetical protein
MKRPGNKGKRNVKRAHMHKIKIKLKVKVKKRET